MQDFFIKLKAEARQVVHDTLAASASLIAPDGTTYTTWLNPLTGLDQDITVRWHNKLARFGDINNSGYPDVLEGVERVIFNVPQLTALGIELDTGWQVIPTSPHYQGATLTLDSMEPITGPVEQVWVVVLNA